MPTSAAPTLIVCRWHDATHSSDQDGKSRYWRVVLSHHKLVVRCPGHGLLLLATLKCQLDTRERERRRTWTCTFSTQNLVATSNSATLCDNFARLATKASPVLRH